MHDGRRRLAGRYELGAIIGRGGMGTVHRATDLVLDRTVAVKVLPAALAAEDADHVERFEREARAAASLAHSGVVAVYDTGVDEGTRFIVMECVDGRSLSDVLREQAPLDAAGAARIASLVAGALAAAHAAGIVHRDIKPGNVMLGRDGEVKVLDFGIARSLDGGTLTSSASLLGTAGYMSPEQARGERADERSDIYSLGCLLYALLTGRAPFTGEAAAAVLHQHLNSDPRPPSAVHPGVPPALDAIVLEMLAKRPSARPQTAAEARDRLDAARTATNGRGPTAAASAAPHQERTARTRVLRRGRAASSRRRAAAAAALGGAALVLIAIIALASGGGAHGPTTRTSRAESSRRTLASRTTRGSTPTAGHATPSPAPAHTTTASPQAPRATVAGAAEALSSLLAQGVQSGAIDQKAARRLESGLAEALAAYQRQHPLDARQALLDLSGRLTKLDEQGGVSPAAAPPLASALASLSSAVLGSVPQVQAAGPTGEAAAAGGDGEPPAKARGHSDRHEERAGD